MDTRETHVFISQLKTATTPTAVTIAIQRAIRHPSLFFYAPLLRAMDALPNVASLVATSQEAMIARETMRLLAYGTIADLGLVPSSSSSSSAPLQSSYYSLPPSLIAGVKQTVTEDRVLLQKLRQLSLCSVCSSSGSREVPYTSLLVALGIVGSADSAALREVEDVVLDAMSNGLLHGKLDQKLGIFVCFDVQARDIEDLVGVASILKRSLALWRDQCIVREEDRMRQSLQGEAQFKADLRVVEAQTSQKQFDAMDAAKERLFVEGRGLPEDMDGGGGRGGFTVGRKRGDYR